MNKNVVVCKKCFKKNGSPLIHCAVCSYPFHVSCVAPKLSKNAGNELIANENFHFYCEEHKNLCVHKLLNRISLLETKIEACANNLLQTLPLVDNEEPHQILDWSSLDSKLLCNVFGKTCGFIVNLLHFFNF